MDAARALRGRSSTLAHRANKRKSKFHNGGSAKVGHDAKRIVLRTDREWQKRSQFATDKQILKTLSVAETDCARRHAVQIEPSLRPPSPKNGSFSNIRRRL